MDLSTNSNTPPFPPLTAESLPKTVADKVRGAIQYFK